MRWSTVLLGAAAIGVSGVVAAPLVKGDVEVGVDLGKWGEKGDKHWDEWKGKEHKDWEEPKKNKDWEENKKWNKWEKHEKRGLGVDADLGIDLGGNKWGEKGDKKWNEWKPEHKNWEEPKKHKDWKEEKEWNKWEKHEKRGLGVDADLGIDLGGKKWGEKGDKKWNEWKPEHKDWEEPKKHKDWKEEKEWNKWEKHEKRGLGVDADLGIDLGGNKWGEKGEKGDKKWNEWKPEHKDWEEPKKHKDWEEKEQKKDWKDWH